MPLDSLFAPKLGSLTYDQGFDAYLNLRGSLSEKQKTNLAPLTKKQLARYFDRGPLARMFGIIDGDSLLAAVLVNLEQDGQLADCAAGKLLYHKFGNVAVIGGLIVPDVVAKRGFGTQLVAACEKHAETHGAKVAAARSKSDNLGSIGAFKKCSFKPFDEPFIHDRTEKIILMKIMVLNAQPGAGAAYP